MLLGGEGDDTYLFNSGDGRDIVVNDVADGFDRIQFGEGIMAGSIALLRNGDHLEIGYGVDDRVLISQFFVGADHQVDEVRLSDGAFLTAADIEVILQEMSAYAVQHGIAMNSFEEVRQQEEFVPLVAGSWQSA